MGPLSPFPEMTFYHARHQVFVDLTTRDEALRMTLTIPFDRDARRRLFDLRCFRPRSFDRWRTLLGMPDKRKRLLDQAGAFTLHTADPQTFGSFFREGAAFRLRELLALPSPGELAVAWTPARFLLQKPVEVFDATALRHAISLSLRLVETLQDDGVLPFGVQAVAASVELEPLIRTSGVVWDPVVGSCRVCGEGLEREIVYCANCSTPHHPDCWEYTGSCAVYACGGKRAVGKVGS